MKKRRTRRHRHQEHVCPSVFSPTFSNELTEDQKMLILEQEFILSSIVASHELILGFPICTDAIAVVCDFLTLADIGSFARTSRQHKNDVLTILSRTKTLDVSRHRFASARALEGLIKSCYMSTSINLSMCSHYRAFGSISSSVTSLNLSKMDSFTDNELMILLPGVPYLSRLNISKTSVSDYGLEIISEECSNLKQLDVSCCNFITSTGVSFLFRGLELEKLNLRGTKIKRDVLSNIAYPLHLEELYLQSCSRLGDFKMIDFFPNLHTLNFSFNTQLNNLTLCLPSLKTLNFSNCKNLRSLKLSCPMLETCMGSSCSLIQNIFCISPCKYLSSASLRQCASLSTDSLIGFILSHEGDRKAPKLTSLDIGGINRVTDSLVLEILYNAENLVSLNVESCRVTQKWGELLELQAWKYVTIS